MPNVEAPRRVEPMEATKEAQSDAPMTGDIVTKQPKPEPQPQAENQMSLRGGGMHLGCTCCDGMCSFNRGCC